ncbi:hypothetical protein KCU65_g5725, partial [Aureobasidium melanogenum]
MTTLDEQNAIILPTKDSTLDVTAVARIDSDMPESLEDNKYALPTRSDAAQSSSSAAPAQESRVPPSCAPEDSPLLSLPDEIKLMVIANLPPEHADSLNLSFASKGLRDISLERFWSIVKEDETLINLQRLPKDNQQTYANFIRELHMTVGDPRIDVSHLRFEKLEKLVIRPPFNPFENPSPMKHNISYLLGPRLTYLKLGVDEYHSYPAFSVSSFLPCLRRSPGLKHLNIGLRIDAQPAELLDALHSCPELETLYVYNQDSLSISHEVLNHIFQSQKIKEFFCFDKLHLKAVQLALDGLPHDQGVMLGLSHLSLDISSDAAEHLLPRLHSIKSLVLHITDTLNVLQSVATMKQLTSLEINFHFATVLSPAALQPLRLLNLECLTLNPGDDMLGEVNGDTITLDDLSYIFGSHKTLRKLGFRWKTTDDTFFNEKLADIMWRLTTAYPKLEDLELPDGRFHLPLMIESRSSSKAPAVTFPRLRSLEILGLQQPSDESQ